MKLKRPTTATKTFLRENYTCIETYADVAPNPNIFNTTTVAGSSVLLDAVPQYRDVYASTPNQRRQDNLKRINEKLTRLKDI